MPLGLASAVPSAARGTHTGVTAMREKSFPAAEHAADDTTAVGIVVQDGPRTEQHPHLAFVWGPEVLPAPSLPFGRWKPAARAA